MATFPQFKAYINLSCTQPTHRGLYPSELQMDQESRQQAILREPVRKPVTCDGCGNISTNHRCEYCKKPLF